MSVYRVHIEIASDVERKDFFEDSLTNEHADATEVECSREVSNYIRDHGLVAFIDDWGLLFGEPRGRVSVYVGRYPAVIDGRPITEKTPKSKPRPKTRRSSRSEQESSA